MHLNVTFADGRHVKLVDVQAFQPVESETMRFMEALTLMSQGSKVRRLSWGGEIPSLAIAIPREDKTKRFIVQNAGPGKAGFWKPTVEDLIADDWWIVV